MIAPLPHIMVAPNGARRTKADHPAVPVTIAETVETAKACFQAGAGGLHAHVRDHNQQHVLDAGLYRELIAEMHLQIPAMVVQITTEAVGRYSAADQRALVRDVMPAAVSVGLNEMMSDDDTAEARSFYYFAHEAGIAVQHILYAPEDVVKLGQLLEAGIVPADGLQVLFVLGRYTKGQQSDPSQLGSFLEQMGVLDADTDWAVCAFGSGETQCLVAAHNAGGKLRIGFENSIWNADGSMAADNAERLRELTDRISTGK